MFTAHSIPTSMAATSPYVDHVTEAARLIAERPASKLVAIGLAKPLGPARFPWLEPDVCEVIEVLGDPRR